MTPSISLMIVLALCFSALMYLTLYYWTQRRWQTYSAGRVLMYLILSLDALIGYGLIGRLIVHDNALRIRIYEVLLVLLTIAVLMIAHTIRHNGVGSRPRRKIKLVKKDDNGD